MNKLRKYLEHIFKPLITDRFDVDTAVNSFLDGIAPRHPASLLYDQKTLEDRARHFSSVMDKSDTDIEARAETQIMIYFGNNQPSARTLVRSLGAKRLRTVHPKLLKTIAENYRTWNPVVTALTNPEKVSPDLEIELKRLLDRLVNIIRSQWRTLDIDQIEDAVQDAFTAAIESLRDPRRGYAYEASLLTWLTNSVLNRLRDQARRPVGIMLPDNLPSNPDNTNKTDETLVLEEWRGRYMLVESFFKGRKSVHRVKAIWEWMLLTMDDGFDKSKDNRMTDYIAMRTGEMVNTDTLIGSRRRLRQRLEAIRYIRDYVPCGAPDSPGDRDLLAHIENTYGLHDKDKPTIRSLGGLVRACPLQRTLHWARLARLVTMNDPSSKEAKKEAETLNPLLDSASDRLARALSDRMVEPVQQLAKLAKADHVGFLLAPCWSLAILDEQTGDAAAQRLKPASHNEEEWIKRMVYELSEGIST